MKVDFLVFSKKSYETIKKFSLKALKLTRKSVKIYIPRKDAAAKRRGGAKREKNFFWRNSNMIKVVYGAKGTGKTKQMIDAANEAVKSAKGHLVFITDTKRGMYDLEREVRFIDVSDFDVAGEAALCGFIKGVIAGNHDNEFIYIDGVMRIAGKKASELGAFFYMLDKVATENNLTITVSISAAREELPDFIAKYL